MTDPRWSELVRRSFVVPSAPEVAWEHLAQVERWPSWARHIRSVRLQPPGALGPDTRGTLRLANGIRSTFAMSELDPPRSWTWVGPFLWLEVRYAHHFEPALEGTRLTWVVEGRGFAVSVLGRLFARVYQRNLDRAIPRLVEELGSPRG